MVDEVVDVERVRALLGDADVVVEPLREPLEGDDVVAVVTWGVPVGEAQLARLPNLRLLMTPSVGFDHLDVEAARRRGVWATSAQDYCVEEMADSTMALLLALLRGIVFLDRDVRAGGWSERAAGSPRRLSATRLGVVGAGRIGRAVIGRATGLGLEVWATDPHVPDQAIAATGALPAPLDELLATCDAVTLHVPLTDETAGLVGAPELARMPRGSYLVNTARGELVDTEALLRALRDGHLAGAALDVLPVEPPSERHPAPRAPNLIVTPHSAYHSVEAEEELVRRIAAAIGAAVEGREPAGVL
jgi:D-3-phosphoglycerate dehydrogenase / 2-oxoglutarate reductase